MTAPSTSFASWLQSLPIPWLVNNEVGFADAAAQGALYDGQVTLLKDAVKARMPLIGPADALPHQGGDRKLIQGFQESDDTFRLRLQTAESQWALAGMWVELLYQLYFSLGFAAGTVSIVQQNGLAYSLSANPMAGQDPTPLLVVTPLGLNYSITPPTGVPWWTFDSRNDLCARFAIILGPGALPSSFLVTGRAIFNGTSNTATADFSWGWDDTSYLTASSPAVTTDGTAPLVAVDATSKTTSSVNVVASAPFTGYVDVLTWLSGSNPFASPSLTTQNLIRTVVNTWRPAKARYMGLYAIANGNLWGWPIGLKWGAASLKWGQPSSYVFLAPQ